MEKLGPRVRVCAAEPLEGFRALLKFADGTQKEIDLEQYLRGPIFEPIRNDPNKFRSMIIEGGTVAWENGADIDPDVLYYNLKPAGIDESPRALSPSGKE
jgi:hypothetical protein